MAKKTDANVDMDTAAAEFEDNVTEDDMVFDTDAEGETPEVYNEDAATNVYDVVLKNSPVQGVDKNLYACLFASAGNEMTLSNRLGQSTTFTIKRLA